MEEKLKFAVFIDFDNIEIGVKSTLNREFDVECVLEGIKERGEVVAKIAYGNWSRQVSEMRALTQQGVQMVQRDTTPRGDKNGADINLALDALEMAFTRDHINAFAIVSGDSDFMALVNKLKQFNKRVYIVGGKGFTSTILQRNCHEFISYESLLDDRPQRPRRGGGQPQRSRPRRSLPVSQVVPLIDRALHALDRRGAQPQLGLLKSTMLQLDSAFTERDFGASSFSSLMEKLVSKGVLTVKTIDGHYVVERKAEGESIDEAGALSSEDALGVLQEVLLVNENLISMGIPPREVQAIVRAVEPDFKETDYGFQEFTELINFAADKGLVRIETSSEKGLRVYPGDELNTAPYAANRRQAEESSEEAAAEPESKPRPSARRPRERSRRRPSSRRGSRREASQTESGTSSDSGETGETAGSGADGDVGTGPSAEAEESLSLNGGPASGSSVDATNAADGVDADASAGGSESQPARRGGGRSSSGSSARTSPARKSSRKTVKKSAEAQDAAQEIAEAAAQAEEDAEAGSPEDGADSTANIDEL